MLRARMKRRHLASEAEPKAKAKPKAEPKVKAK
jgi:hypothetical protein